MKIFSKRALTPALFRKIARNRLFVRCLIQPSDMRSEASPITTFIRLHAFGKNSWILVTVRYLFTDPPSSCRDITSCCSFYFEENPSDGYIQEAMNDLGIFCGALRMDDEVIVCRKPAPGYSVHYPEADAQLLQHFTRIQSAVAHELALGKQFVDETEILFARLNKFIADQNALWERVKF